LHLQFAYLDADDDTTVPLIDPLVTRAPHETTVSVPALTPSISYWRTACVLPMPGSGTCQSIPSPPRHQEVSTYLPSDARDHDAAGIENSTLASVFGTPGNEHRCEAFEEVSKSRFDQ
jgi:hypothetical protein